MLAQKENSFSPPKFSSPGKQASIGSPPMKQPRNPTLYSDYDPEYQPASREQILGTPIEIIQGKNEFHKFGRPLFILGNNLLIFYRQTILGE